MLPSVAALLLAGVGMLQRRFSGGRRSVGGGLAGVSTGQRCYHGATVVLPRSEGAVTNELTSLVMLRAGMVMLQARAFMLPARARRCQ